MRVLMVVFHLPQGSTPAVHRDFRQAVYGANTSSMGGRYRYRRRGLLDDIPHVRLYWGTVLILERDFKHLRKLFKVYSAEYEIREVKPLKKDLKVLEVALQ